MLKQNVPISSKGASNVRSSEQTHAQEVVDERRRGLIRVLAWSEIGLLVVGLLVQLLPVILPPQRPMRNPSTLIVFVIGFATAGGILYLLREKRTQAAAYGLIYSFAFITVASIVGTATSKTASIALLLQLAALFYLVVLWAGLLIGPWNAFVTATLGSAALSIGLAMHSTALQRGDLPGY